MVSFFLSTVLESGDERDFTSNEPPQVPIHNVGLLLVRKVAGIADNFHSKPVHVLGRLTDHLQINLKTITDQLLMHLLLSNFRFSSSSTLPLYRVHR